MMISMSGTLQCLMTNGDPGLTLIYFTTRSKVVVYAFEWRKTVTLSFDERKLQQMTK